MKQMKEILRRALIGAFWIGIWWAIALAVGLPKLLPGPGETALAFARLCGTDTFWWRWAIFWRWPRACCWRWAAIG